ADVLARTPRPRGFTVLSWVVISSVKPSLKYSCAGSPLRLSNGRTARATRFVAGRARRAGRWTTTYATRASTHRDTTAIQTDGTDRRSGLRGAGTTRARSTGAMNR